MRITKQISDKVYEVELTEFDFQKEFQLTVAHDYIGFSGNQSLSTKDSNVKLFGENQICSNGITIGNYVQIPIRMFSQFVMSHLHKHEYLQPEHLTDSEGKNKYSYNNSVIKYYDVNQKCYMVAICLIGESTFNHVTLEFYNKFVKPNLK